MKPSDMFLKNINILQEWLAKIPAVSTKHRIEITICYRTRFTSSGVLGSKIMLYYHDGPQGVWRKPLTALENKYLIPTVKFGELFVMVWCCISTKVVGVIRILDEIMTKEVCLGISKNELIVSSKKFSFINPDNPNNDIDVVQLINIQLLRWFGHVVRMLRLDGYLMRGSAEVGEEDDLVSIGKTKSRKPCHWFL